jgi:hypothetical protein
MAKKEELLQVRLTGRLKFAIGLIAQQEGRKQTQIVEEAIEARAAALKLGVPFDVLYDDDEGMRTLACLALPSYRPTEAEREIKAFVQHHPEFFYADKEQRIPHRGFVSILWPKLEHYMHTWRERRHEDYWAAADAMAKALSAARVKPPKYGK